MERKSITLCELLGEVKTALKNTLPYSWWITAEISEIKVNYSGHCYLELIEKNEDDETIKAKVRATIWSSVFRMLKPYFETTTGSGLVAGIRIMVKVNAEFHELYGFSLNITDIEPSYTIGELARQKLEIIKRLKAEGVFDMNRSLEIPDIPCKLAIISSPTAAGYGDFVHQLDNNAFGYKFYVKLFPAVMQGLETEQTIIAALDRIYQYEDFFDAVIIIRGGGSQSDLNCFNSYWLCLNICQFPLPVLTGIGHEQDETVADLVACMKLKTPTAVAEFLISKMHDTEEAINEKSMALYDMVTEKLNFEKERLNRIIMQLKPVVKDQLNQHTGALKIQTIQLQNMASRQIIRSSADINNMCGKLISLSANYFHNQSHRIEVLEKKAAYLDPFIILKRGYSVTYQNGKALKDSTAVNTNQEIETRLAQGTIKSRPI
jgi:exodeoxyribonuclease VII large subunit